MSAKKTKTNNIKLLWRQVYTENKTPFITEAAEHFKVEPITIRTNWVSKDFSPPSKHRSEFVKMIQNQIKLQNEYKWE